MRDIVQYLALIAGLVLIIAVMGFFGLSEIAAVLLNANYGYILIAVGIEIAFLLLLALRLKIISSRFKALPFKDAFSTNTTGIFVGFLSPLARIGGEPVKIYLLKDKIGATKSSAIVAIDTLVEVFSLYITIAVAVSLLSGNIPQPLFSSLFVFLFLSIYASIIFLKICSDKRWLEGIIRWLSRFRRFSKLKEKDYAGMFHSSFRLLLTDKKMLVASFSISILTKILEFLRLWIILLALGQHVPLDLIVLFWAFLLILSAIPFLPGGLGLIEGGGTLALVWIGIEKSVAASAVLIDRLVSYWLVLLIGLIIIWRSKYTYRFLKKLKK
ncbi:MAG: flippase-like domain-containing protein [Candidatus Aenigmarchaeota archaeon]|nr:flippase-like domain-containing protein [Candidatus Aenigmarchaeota archaeon]